MSENQKATWQEVEKECVLLKALVERMPEEERAGAVIRLCCEAVIWGAFNEVEALGIFEEAKFQYRETAQRILQEEEEE